jgi:hypothetical protein
MTQLENNGKIAPQRGPVINICYFFFNRSDWEGDTRLSITPESGGLYLLSHHKENYSRRTNTKLWS